MKLISMILLCSVAFTLGITLPIGFFVQSQKKIISRLRSLSSSIIRSINKVNSKTSIDSTKLTAWSNSLRHSFESSSPLNKQNVLVKGPFFQGWLIRITDNANNCSCILIIGSFSGGGSLEYDEHYLFCGFCSTTQVFHADVFPDQNDVHVYGSPPLSPLNISWVSGQYGKFKFDTERCIANFAFKNIKLKVDISGRRPWSLKSNREGPEGWLGYTSLLPCHYYVYSVGSKCTYDISIAETNRYSGKGYAHIEGNHGTFFPSGWVWSQAIAKDNVASFSLVGGRFQIGPIAPMNWIFFVRIHNSTYIYRTTELDRVKYNINPHNATVEFTATSALGGHRVSVLITSTDKLDAFSPPIFTPSPSGFSNSPGCREIYTADTQVVLSEIDRETGEYKAVHRLQFPLTALEFGGTILFGQ